MLASGYNRRSDEEKVALILPEGGDVLLDIYNSFDWSNARDKDVDDTMAGKFDAYFRPRTQLSELAARYKFNSTIQKEDETTGSFIPRVRIIDRLRIWRAKG